jgi:nucleoside-diphosphate-sugar epimerase
VGRLLLFGPGYCGSRIAAVLRADGWEVRTVGRSDAPDVGWATHVLSTVPPTDEGDPVLAAHDPSGGRWLGYLSSTGVYGDAGGAWVDEGAPLRGRRPERIAADGRWLALGACVLRLPGIYGPGRSPLERVRAGQAHRVGLPDQVFSRIHVDDIVAGVRLAIGRGATGAFNLADDLPAPQDAVVEHAAHLLGLAPPPVVGLDALSPAARAFYGENRRVAAGKARRLLGWRPACPTYRDGLRALIASTSPATASMPPSAASADQR